MLSVCILSMLAGSAAGSACSGCRCGRCMLVQPLVAAGAIRGADSGTAGARYPVKFPGVVSVLVVVVLPEIASVLLLADPGCICIPQQVTGIHLPRKVLTCRDGIPREKSAGGVIACRT